MISLLSKVSVKQFLLSADSMITRYIRSQSQLFSDQEYVVTDPRIYVYDSQLGAHTLVNPSSRASMTPRRETTMRPIVPPTQTPQSVVTQQPVVLQTPIAQPLSAAPTPAQSPVKASPPTISQHARTPSSGAHPQRPSSSASVHSMQGTNGPSSSPQAAHAAVTQTPVPAPAAQKSPVNVTAQVSLPIVNGSVANGVTTAVANGTMNGLNGLANFQQNANVLTPAQQQAYMMQMQKKIFAQQYAQRNGQATYSQQFTNGLAGMNGLNGLNGASTDANANLTNMNFTNPVAMNLKLPTQRQMQWANAGQRTQMLTNGDVAALQNMQNMQSIPFANLLQAQALNGHLSPARNAHSPPNVHAQGGMSPQHQALLAQQQQLSHSLHVGSSQPQIQAHTHTSPARNMQTPVPPSPSPLLQHQMPSLVGSMPSQGQGF